MPSMLKYYRNIEKRNSYRNRARKRNYDKGWVDSNHRKWTKEEDILVLTSDMTDRELSKEINRSVTSIQIHRSRLNKVRNNFKLNNNFKM